MDGQELVQRGFGLDGIHAVIEELVALQVRRERKLEGDTEDEQAGDQRLNGGSLQAQHTRQAAQHQDQSDNSGVCRIVPGVCGAQHRHEHTRDDQGWPRNALRVGTQTTHEVHADKQHADRQRQRDLMRVQIAV